MVEKTTLGQSYPLGKSLSSSALKRFNISQTSAVQPLSEKMVFDNKAVRPGTSSEKLAVVDLSGTPKYVLQQKNLDKMDIGINVARLHSGQLEKRAARANSPPRTTKISQPNEQDAANAYEFFTRQLSVKDYYMYNPRGVDERLNIVNNLQDCLSLRRLDIAPEILTKNSLPKKHQQAKEKKFAVENDFFVKKLAVIKRINDGSKSVGRILSHEKNLKFNGVFPQSGIQSSSLQQVKAKPATKRAVSDLHLDPDTSQPADLATLWNFIQEAKTTAAGTNIYNLSNHFHGGTYNYSPVFNSNTIGNNLFRHRAAKLPKESSLNDYVSVMPVMMYQKEDHPPVKRPTYRLKKRVQQPKSTVA